MRWNHYKRITGILLLFTLLSGAVHAAGVGIIAGTQEISGGGMPVCTAPCECISEAEAAARWGNEGYDRCSKTICGQSANAMVQYYCFRQVGGTVSSSLTTCQAPCECLSEAAADAKWGSGGYAQCSKNLCGQDAATGGTVPEYCFRQWGSTLVIGGAATTVPMAATTLVTGGEVTTAPAQQTQAQAPAAAAPATTASSYTWPAADAVPQKTPAGVATVIAAIGTALLAAAGMRRK